MWGRSRRKRRIRYRWLVFVIFIIFREAFSRFSFEFAQPLELLKLGVAKNLNLLICEGTLNAIFVPSQTIITEMFKPWLIFECLLRIHKESVGFSVVAKVGELE